MVITRIFNVSEFLAFYIYLTLWLPSSSREISNHKSSQFHIWHVKRICDFEHSVMTNFNCACPAIQKGQGSGFLSEGSSWLTACMSEQWRFWWDCADAQARLNLRCLHRQQVPNSLDAAHIKVWCTFGSFSMISEGKSWKKCRNAKLR